MQAQRSSLSSFTEIVCLFFALAVRDRLLPDTRATGLKYQKCKKPIRKTPTIEEFRAAVANIHAQVYHADFKDTAPPHRYWQRLPPLG